MCVRGCVCVCVCMSHPQQLLRQVTSLVDAAVHGDEALDRWLVPHVGVVQAGVEHDDGEGEHIARVCGTHTQRMSFLSFFSLNLFFHSL